MIYIGCHLSVTNGYLAMGKTMSRFGGNTFAWFTRNPRGGRTKPVIPEDAEALLRTYISRFESELYSFMIRTGVQLNQNQFDALMLFSYNCGTAWAYSTTGGLYNAVVSGATGNELIDALTRWCNAGGQIKTFLLRRRLSEANIYLNGEYSQTPPENFGYVLYDACGGTTKPNVQGYDAALTSQIIPEPVREGYTFAGWYTEKLGGTKVELLDASVRNSRLYAECLAGRHHDRSLYCPLSATGRYEEVYDTCCKECKDRECYMV